MTNQVAVKKQTEPGVLERVLIAGDLSVLNGPERIEYYAATCTSLGLNPLTKPFDYIDLNGKLTLYAKKDCTDQLRAVRDISVKITDRQLIDGVYVVTARAKTPNGREDESTGAVPLVKEGGEWRAAQSGKKFFQGNGQFEPLKPEDRANAFMKAETKAKRRVTLSICGLGIIDESELDTVREARKVHIDYSTGEILGRDTPPPIEPPTISQPQPAAHNHTTPTTAKEAVRANSAHSGETDARQSPERREIPPASSPEPAPLPDAVRQLWGRMGTKITSVCQVFGELKKDFEEVTGADRGYYEVLARNGFEHADDVRKQGINRARQCVRELFETLERYRTGMVPPSHDGLEISDDDIPTVIGGTYEAGANPAERRAAQ